MYNTFDPVLIDNRLSVLQVIKKKLSPEMLGKDFPTPAMPIATASTSRISDSEAYKANYSLN